MKITSISKLKRISSIFKQQLQKQRQHVQFQDKRKIIHQYHPLFAKFIYIYIHKLLHRPIPSSSSSSSSSSSPYSSSLNFNLKSSLLLIQRICRITPFPILLIAMTYIMRFAEQPEFQYMLKGTESYLFCIGVLLAQKCYSDKSWTNKEFSELMNSYNSYGYPVNSIPSSIDSQQLPLNLLPLSTINKMELEMMMTLDFDLMVTQEEYHYVLKHIRYVAKQYWYQNNTQIEILIPPFTSFSSCVDSMVTNGIHMESALLDHYNYGRRILNVLQQQQGLGYGSLKFNKKRRRSTADIILMQQ